ncbi:MAG: radical SAM protein [Solirubrobacteraceae bacterium]
MSAAQLRPLAGGPAWIVIQLLERCNLRCNMCYEWGESGAFKSLPSLAELDVDVLLERLEECLPGKPRIEFFGGEPLLYRSIWRLLEVLRDAGCEVAFPTNGTTLARHADRLVSANPTRIWVSLDGPRAINDAQRGAGVYDRATRGIEAIDRLKQETGLPYPELGVIFVVTPDNHNVIEEFFLGLDLSRLGAVSIEMQSYVTAEQHRHYARVAHEKFGVTTTPSAEAYVRDPAMWANVDPDPVARQLRRVRDECRQRGMRFFSQPRALEADTIAAYISANWTAMADYHQRCAVPWMTAEISARGDVTTCHSFYDITVGNIYDRSLIDIWHGERAGELRSHLRRELFSVCTACTRYYAPTAHPIAPKAEIARTDS